MAKVFSVEQLRINDRLLTGSADGLFIDGQQLALGTSSVPLTRKLYAGEGLKISNGPGYADLSADRTFDVDYGPGLAINGSDQLYIANNTITEHMLSTTAWGLGLVGGGGNAIDVGAGSGLHAQGNHVDIDVLGVTNAMLAGSIADSKLNTITTAGKVEGSAVELNIGGTIADDDGLKVANNKIGKVHLTTDVAGEGLAGGNNTALYVGAGSGLWVQGDNVNINVLGVTNGMLAGSITDSKLNQITSADKVAGSAVELASDGTIEDDSGLKIANNKITESHLTVSVAGAGLAGGNGTALFVGAGSGMHVEGNQVHINNTGISTEKIKDGAVTPIKLAGSIPVDKTLLSAGNGLILTNDQIDAIGGTGILINANDINVDVNVVRTDANATQTLAGNYTFSETLLLSSGITIGGDLQVRGQTVITEQNQVNIGDNIIVLNSEYIGNTPPDAGIEIERDASTYGNAMLIFDDDTAASAGGDVWKAGYKGSEHMLHTAKTMRTYSKVVKSGVTKESVLFGYTFPSTPTVVVSIQNTGQELQPSRDPDLMAALVTAVNTTGFNVDFSSRVDGDQYYLKAFVEGGAVY